MVLVDSSVWIAYFRHNTYKSDIAYLIDENLLVTNQLILAELIPSLKIHNQLKLIKMLQQIKRLSLDIDWQDINEMKIKCLKNGILGIGIVDMMIAQNASHHQAVIFSEDKHFSYLQKVLNISLYEAL